MTGEVGQCENRREAHPGDAQRAVPDGLAWGALA